MSTQFLTQTDGRIAYDVTGPADGKLIVCMHGLGDDRRTFRLLAPGLAEAGFRVVTVDLGGCGESDAGRTSYTAMRAGADVLELIRHLGGPAVVLGHSFTGGSAVWIATEAPDVVTGVILMDPFVRDHPMNAVVKLASKLVSRNAALWGMYYKSLYPVRKPADFDQYLKGLKSMLREPGRLAALTGMMDSSQAENEARIPSVRCPALIVMGTKDSDFPDPKAEAELIAGKLTTPVTIEYVQDAGHYPHADTPDVTAAAILKFITEV